MLIGVISLGRGVGTVEVLGVRWRWGRKGGGERVLRRGRLWLGLLLLLVLRVGGVDDGSA